MKHNSCFSTTTSPKGIVKTFGNKFYYFTKIYLFIHEMKRAERREMCLRFECGAGWNNISFRSNGQCRDIDE